ncbi:MAG: hypothetical protein IVW57_16710, partial [Ktedonobacterales bacterium]|nr:hypothetical protein [Ktedonobacterales bacterium]
MSKTSGPQPALSLQLAGKPHQLARVRLPTWLSKTWAVTLCLGGAAAFGVIGFDLAPAWGALPIFLWLCAILVTILFSMPRHPSGDQLVRMSPWFTVFVLATLCGAVIFSLVKGGLAPLTTNPAAGLAASALSILAAPPLFGVIHLWFYGIYLVMLVPLLMGSLRHKFDRYRKLRRVRVRHWIAGGLLASILVLFDLVFNGAQVIIQSGVSSPRLPGCLTPFSACPEGAPSGLVRALDIVDLVAVVVCLVIAFVWALLRSAFQRTDAPARPPIKAFSDLFRLLVWPLRPLVFLAGVGLAVFLAARVAVLS